MKNKVGKWKKQLELREGKEHTSVTLLSMQGRGKCKSRGIAHITVMSAHGFVNNGHAAVA
jgi:hypothetical protein